MSVSIVLDHGIRGMCSVQICATLKDAIGLLRLFFFLRIISRRPYFRGVVSCVQTKDLPFTEVMFVGRLLVLTDPVTIGGWNLIDNLNELIGECESAQ